MAEVRALHALGRLGEARDLAEDRLGELGVETAWGGWFPAYLVSTLAAQSHTDDARSRLDELEEVDADPEMLAWAYAGLGITDEAFQAYAALERDHWGRIGTISGVRYPDVFGLSALKNDPRYRTLVRRVNEYWDLEPDGSLPHEEPAAQASERKKAVHD